MYSKFVAAVALTTALFAGCAKQPQTTSAPAGTNVPGAPAASAAPAGAALAHIELAGALKISRDVGVKSCAIAKPGKTLLSGYSITLDRHVDTVIESGGFHVPSYDHDGTYTIHAYGQSMAADPFQLSFLPSATLPKGSTLVAKPESSLAITIENGGMKGMATFKNWKTLYLDGGVALGSITWTCPKIVRL